MAKVKVRALRPFFGSYGKVKAGDEVEVSEAHAKRFIDRGLAVPASYKREKPALNKMEGSPANKAEARPSTGGQTGKAKQSPSSPAGQVSKTSPSTKSEDAAE